MKLHNKITVSQSISPSVIQMLNIVQMTSTELAQFVFEQAMENPAIDIDALYNSGKQNLITEKLDWLSSFKYRGDRLNTDDESDRHQQPEGRQVSDIRGYLTEQVSDLNVSGRAQAILKFLIGCVDEHGFLNENPDNVAAQLGTDAESVADCIDILRALPPVGLCSENIYACLCAQLDAQANCETAKRIVKAYLEELSRGHYSHIAKALSVSVKEVRAAEAQIKALRPYPCSYFDSCGGNHYIYPDITVEKIGDELSVSLASSFTPYLRISSYCRELQQSSEDPEVKKYICDSIQRASQLYQNISKSERTLKACASALIEFQRDYFMGKSQALSHVSLDDIAEASGLSISTVSRAFKGKYIQCARGVIPVKLLLSRKAEGGDKSSSSVDGIKSAIAEIVSCEDPGAPISDSQLATILSRRGVKISRRTVAKYRDELCIPSTFIRKQK